MIILQTIFLFLFWDNFIHVKAQLNSCIAPNGEKGICVNIWNCKHQIKYLFSEEQNSMQTFNILKSICDYTNSTIKLCCILPPITEQSLISNNKNFNKRDVRENYNQNKFHKLYYKNKRIKRKISNFFQSYSDCNSNSSNENNDNNDENNNNKIAEKIVDEKLSNQNDNLDIKKPENISESITFNYDHNNSTTISPQEIDINKQISEMNNSGIEKYETTEITPTESSNLNCNKSSSNDEDIKIIKTNILKLSTLVNKINEKIEIVKKNNPFENSIQHSDYDNNLDSVEKIKSKIPIEFNVTMKPENQIQNNTFIIINMNNNSRTNEDASNEETEIIELSDTNIDDGRVEETPNDEDYDYTSLPKPPYCGKNTKYNPNKGEYPWHVLLKERDIISTNLFCRGTLITPSHIITTAYCIESREIESVLIPCQKKSGYKTLKIKDIKVHDAFVPHRLQNDIALIRLKEPIRQENVFPICLNVDSNLSNLTEIIASSPGYIRDKNFDVGKPSLKMQEIITEVECTNMLRDLKEHLYLDNNVLCTHSLVDDDDDICMENEGNPLMTKNTYNGHTYNYQIGIASELNHCGDIGYPGLFVNIQLYLNWILNNM